MMMVPPSFLPSFLSFFLLFLVMTMMMGFPNPATLTPPGHSHSRNKNGSDDQNSHISRISTYVSIDERKRIISMKNAVVWDEKRKTKQRVKAEISAREASLKLIKKKNVDQALIIKESKLKERSQWGGDRTQNDPKDDDDDDDEEEEEEEEEEAEWGDAVKEAYGYKA